MSDTIQLDLPGFSEIRYKGKALKGFTGTMRTIVMQKNNPDRLDMRFKTNREFVAEQNKWHESHKPSGEDFFKKEYINKFPTD